MRLRKLLATAFGGGLALVCAVSIASGAPGDLDPGFNGTGKLVLNFGGSDSANAVAIQPDGKILIAGVGPGADFVISRILPSGSLDLSFGGGTGTTRMHLAGAAKPTSLAIAADGKIVVAGSVVASASNRDAAVARLDSAGTPDSSFGIAGWRDVDFGGDNDEASGVAVLSDGRILLSGTGGPSRIFMVARLTAASGKYDGTFAGGGLTTIPGTENGDAHALALAPDGKIVVVGTVYANGHSDIGVARLDAGGTPDSNFDGNGVRVVNSGVNEEGAAVAVQPDGRVLAAGNNQIQNFLLMRFDTGGSPDNGFNGDGTVKVAFAAGTQFARALALQPDGKIVLAGKAEKGMGFARVQPGGALDTTFSGDGRQVVLFSSESNDAANGVAIEPDDGIVGAGVVGPGAGNDIALARLQGQAAGGAGGPGGGGGGTSGASLKCAGKRATIVGTNGRDKLKGTRRADVIVGLGGNDKVDGGGGNDLICGGNGNDSLGGGAGKDKVYGQAGKDSLSGGAGNDTLSGGAGKDHLTGGAGKDRLSGGAGKDRCSGHDRKSSC